MFKYDPRDFIQTRTARQRALAKLGAFALGTLLFVMLACQPGPPFSVILVDGPGELFPNDSAEYLFEADYFGYKGLPAGSTIDVSIYHHSMQEPAQQTVTTDADGRFVVNATMPAQAIQNDNLRLNFTLIDEERDGQQGFYIRALPEITVEYLNQAHAWGSGPIADLVVRLIDNRNKRALVNTQWQAATLSGPEEMQVQSSGTTDANGIATITVDNRHAPVWGLNYAIGITVETENGSFTQSISGSKGVESFDVLVSTDKPIYQPGQTIQLRALALRKTSMKAAADRPIAIQLVDPMGTIIANKAVETSAYGIATAEFPLDSQVASGDYTVRAETDFGIYSRIVEVKPYTLPRFEIAFATDKPFYAPGDTATGSIDANYFFGKPVANGTVRISGYAASQSGTDKTVLFTLEGETDATGHYAYEVSIDKDLIDQQSNESVAVELEISVIDSANHAEQTDAQLIVAQQPLLFEAVAESGNLHPGVENIVFIQASTPDGRPAQETLTVAVYGEEETVTTDQYGLATINFVPKPGHDAVTLLVHAHGSDGNAAGNETDAVHLPQKINMTIDDVQSARLLLRPEKAEISVGESLNLDILLASEQERNSDGDVVLVQVTKQGYLYMADAVTLQGNRATATLQLDPALMGTIEISAQLLEADMLPSGQEYFEETFAADSRLVLINPSAMQIDATADAEEYRPGDQATLEVQLSQDGQPVQGMLGLSIVDESVFALGAQDPAFARTYFLIDRELTKPHYGIDGFAPFGNEPSPYLRDHRLLASASTTAQSIAALQQSQQKALFGLMAQELQWAATAHATAHAAAPQPLALSPAKQHSLGEKRNSALSASLLLVAVAVGVGRRNRKETLTAITIILASTIIWTACAAPAGAPAADGGSEMDASAAEAMVDPIRETGGSVVNEQTAAKPRLRQFFPETLLWLPEVETDEEGRAQIDLAVADSITTWRVSIVASDKEGNLGSAQLPMRVFQEFFVEPNLPLYLTEGDEIDVPVSIFNYLDEEQNIDLEIEPADWFTIRGNPTLSVAVAGNEVASTYIPIRVLDAGQGSFQLTATGSTSSAATASDATASDAIVRNVTVQVNGQQQERVINGTLRQDVLHTLNIDERAIADESTVTVRFYPSAVSEMVSGLEAMLSEPNGCFEQTSSTNYPNVMILDYLRATEQNVPHIEQRANGFVERGYQRLLPFEVPNNPGAFSLWGTPPPQLMLTAYGLMQFTDQSKVTYVDPALLDRIASYLSQSQKADGSWAPTGMMNHGDFSALSHTAISTAYITWALADADMARPSVDRGVDYLQAALANQEIQSNYGLAMVANAFIAAGVPQSEVEGVLDLLVNAAVKTDADAANTDTVSWQAGRTTYMGGYAQAADVETSAMAAIALMRAEYRLDVATKAIQALQETRPGGGYYYSTQATVLVLKAMTLHEQQKRTLAQQGSVVVSLNGDERQRFELSTIDPNRPIELTFSNVPIGQNELEIQLDGETALSYQVVTESYLPWPVVLAQSAAEGESDSVQNAAFNPTLELDVAYSATDVALHDTVDVAVEMTLLAAFPQSNLMAEIGLPPGFRPAASDLEALVASNALANYEIRRDRVVLYIAEMTPEQAYAFNYRLTAQVPGTVQAPPSFGYPYYASNLRTIDAPQVLVTRGK